jgi:hypothetical protein
MDGLLEDMRGLFPLSLIGMSGWETLQALTRRLPICVAHQLFGFEFHLSDATPETDFFVVSPLGSHLAEFYEGQNRGEESNVIGADLRRFLEEQARDPQSFMARTGASVILEYDLVGVPPGRHSVPGFFIVSPSSSVPVKSRIHDDPEGLLGAVLAAAGWERDVVPMSQIEQVWTALGQKGVVKQAGAMPGRQERAVRLIVHGFAIEDISEVLGRLKWQGDQALAVSVLSEFAGLVAPSASLSIDISSGGMSSRLGLELFRPTGQYRIDRAGWCSLINRLEERGWCLPAKAEGMREWPRMEMLMARGDVYRVRQFINHIKLVVKGKTVSAKAYTGCGVAAPA